MLKAQFEEFSWQWEAFGAEKLTLLQMHLKNGFLRDYVATA